MEASLRLVFIFFLHFLMENFKYIKEDNGIMNSYVPLSHHNMYELVASLESLSTLLPIILKHILDGNICNYLEMYI